MNFEGHSIQFITKSKVSIELCCVPYSRKAMDRHIFLLYFQPFRNPSEIHLLVPSGTKFPQIHMCITLGGHVLQPLCFPIRLPCSLCQMGAYTRSESGCAAFHHFWELHFLLTLLVYQSWVTLIYPPWFTIDTIPHCSQGLRNRGGKDSYWGLHAIKCLMP